MNIAGLSLDQSPPLLVPGPYFATAPLFALAAGLLLVISPELLQDRWLPGTLALTHLLTLGFAAMVMVGAFQQLLPVLIGAPVPRPRLVGLSVYGLLLGGAVALPWGMASSAPALMLVAMVLLAVAFGIFIGVGGWCLARARSAHATVSAMSGALAALLITAALGLHLASGHAGLAPLARRLTDLHAVWGTVGWIGLLLMGVAYQVVPMFQITPEYPRVMMRGLVPVVFAVLVIWTASTMVAPTLTLWLGMLLALGAVLFALATLVLQHRRRRRLSDVTVDFWRLAMGALLLAAAIAVVSALVGRPQPAVLLGVLFLAGFAVSVISGMSYKIVPFLVWLHLNNRIFTYPQLRGRVPNMKQVIPERRTRRQFRLHAAAVVLLVLAAATGDTAVTRLAGAVFAVSAALLAYNLSGALRLYVRLLREQKGP